MSVIMNYNYIIRLLVLLLFFFLIKEKGMVLVSEEKGCGSGLFGFEVKNGATV